MCSTCRTACSPATAQLRRKMPSLLLPPSDLPVRRSQRRSGAADGSSLAERSSPADRVPSGEQRRARRPLTVRPSVPEASGIRLPMTSHLTHSCMGHAKGGVGECDITPNPAELHPTAERSMRRNSLTLKNAFISRGLKVNLLTITTRWAEKTLLRTTTRQQVLPLQ